MKRVFSCVLRLRFNLCSSEKKGALVTMVFRTTWFFGPSVAMSAFACVGCSNGDDVINTAHNSMRMRCVCVCVCVSPGAISNNRNEDSGARSQVH